MDTLVAKHNKRHNAASPVLRGVWLLENLTSDSPPQQAAFQAEMLSRDPTTIDAWVNRVLTGQSAQSVTAREIEEDRNATALKLRAETRSVLIAKCVAQQSQIALLTARIAARLSEIFAAKPKPEPEPEPAPVPAPPLPPKTLLHPSMVGYEAAFPVASERLAKSALLERFSKFVLSASKPPTARPSHTFRVVTWNVFMLQSLKGNDNVVGILATIKQLDADALCTQEEVARPAFSKGMLDLGYKHSVTGTTSAGLQNSVYWRASAAHSEPRFSQFELPLMQRTTRWAAITRLRWTSERCLWLCTIHLDVYDETSRTRQAQLADMIRRIDAKEGGILPTDAIVVAGDFNSNRTADCNALSSDVKTLELMDSAGFVDASDLRRTLIPVSCWFGSRVDFLFCKNIHSDQVRNVFPHMTLESDHLPIVLDLVA